MVSIIQGKMSILEIKLELIFFRMKWKSEKFPVYRINPEKYRVEFLKFVVLRVSGQELRNSFSFVKGTKYFKY